LTCDSIDSVRATSNKDVKTDETKTNPFRILVADDESSVLDVFRQVLSTSKFDPPGHLETEAFGRNSAIDGPPLSFDLVTVSTGREAVNAVKRSMEKNRPFSVAFVDIRMPPGPDGIWTAEQTRRLDDHVEILIMTGYTDTHPRDISRRVPPVHKLLFVQKPFHIQEIHQFASALSMKWHTECELQELNKGLEQCIEARIHHFEILNKELQAKLVELQKARSALTDSEGKLNAMIGSIPDHISMMDKDLNIIWANTIAMENFGHGIIGKKCYEVYHQRKKPCEPYPCSTLKAFKDGQIHGHEFQVIDKNGNARFFYLTANVALRDENQNPTAVMEVSRDITGQKRAELALIEARDDLDRRVKERTAELEDALETIRRNEKELIERKSALEILNRELMETNQALSVLARNMERDKDVLRKKIYETYTAKILPIISAVRLRFLEYNLTI